MMSLLPTVLVPAECLSLAELCAARLDGEVLPLDECFLAIDTPDTAASRADALRAIAGERAIAASESALWIYGVLAAAPRVHTVCIDRENRAAAPHSLRLRVHETRFLPGDLLWIGAMAVTTPLRTIYDLARSSKFTDLARDGIRALAVQYALDETACRARLDAVRNLPGRKRAVNRLRGPLGWSAS